MYQMRRLYKTRNLTNVSRRNHERRRTDWSLTALTYVTSDTLHRPDRDLVDSEKKKRDKDAVKCNVPK